MHWEGHSIIHQEGVLCLFQTGAPSPHLALAIPCLSWESVFAHLFSLQGPDLPLDEGSAHRCWGGSASGDFSKAKMHRTSAHPRRSTAFCFLHSQSSVFSKQLLPCPQHHPCGWIFLLLWMRPRTLLQEGLCSVSERLSHQGDLLPEAMCP